MATDDRAIVIEVPDLRGGYVEVVRRVAREGRPASPRGRRTLELLRPVLEISDPTDVLPLGVGRKPNLDIAAIEALQLLAGFGAPDLVRAASPNFRAFEEPDGSFHGNYGDRVGDQLASAIEKLRRDPETRQAVINLWDGRLDNQPNKRDYPCTVALQFLLRDSRLNLIATMRSNDVWLGLAYDAFQFCQVLLTAARALGANPGWYSHRPGSLHLYEDDLARVEQLTTPTGPPGVFALGIGRGVAGGAEVVERARHLLRGGLHSDTTGSELWYQARVADLRVRAALGGR